jgi:amino acid adenylation domain-containing protein/non-ribosomal peptide synthase protein (TIGR01720 family)
MSLERNAVVASYSLTPLQQGMMVHHLLDAASGVDVEQLECVLREPVDARGLRSAWQQVSARHDVLRTVFRREDDGTLVQDVYASAELEWLEEDWRDVPAAELTRRFEQFLEADRRRGFDLSALPLQRFVLLRIADEEWRLLWTFHHAILDGRSFLIVLEEVFERYDARRSGAVAERPAPRPYREFVEWHQGRDFARDETSWRERLRGFTTPTPRPANVDAGIATDGARQGEREVHLGASTTSALTSLAEAAGVTMTTLAQSAWALLLARHAGERDVVFGVTRAGRKSAIDGAERMVGLLINTLPLRVRVDGDASVMEWLRTVRAAWNDLRAVEHTPLAKVQGWSDVPRGTALFDTLVVVENYLLESSLRAKGGAWAERRIRLHEQTNYALTLAVYGGAELTLKLDYDRTRVTDATAERVLAQLACILEGMAADPQTRVEDLPWMTEAERELVIETFNRTTREYPRDETIARRFAAMVQCAPDAVAVVHKGHRLTYRELDARANQLARRLRRLGVGPDVLVGLCVERSLDMIVAVLGIVKAGGAYLTLDPEYPAERLAFMLADSGAPVVVTEDALAGHFVVDAHAAPTILRLDGERDEIAREDDGAIEEVGSAENLAYVIFTSGSTGTPKGVAATQRGVMRLVCNPDYAELGADETLLSFAPLNFDASTLEIWGPLLNGGRLVVFPERTASLEALAAVIAEEGVTTMWLTAALFHQMVDTQLDALRPLRQLLAGGDVLSVPHVRRVRSVLPHVRLVNGYGPTENTTFTCCHTIGAPDTIGSSVPIGRPIANTTVYLLDERGQPVPIGVAGRLYTGGDGLARGYLNRPELTAERFVRNSFAAQPDARMYDTGDLARWRLDGTIEFLGRADQQLKVRGYRIEPGEIEAALLRDARVREAVVIGREDVPGDKRLVAYVVPSAGLVDPGTLIDSLRADLRETLPPYMVPSAFVVLHELPLTSSGKVDRRRLPAPELDRDALSRPYVAPTSAAERALAEIWGAVLRLERVGVHDNFFELGGDSILSIQIAARARTQGLPLSVSMLRHYPNIAELAAAMEPMQTSTTTETASAIAVAPLTPIQRWFFELDPVERNHWNQTFLFRTAQPLEHGALRAALEALVQHHDALRLRFSAEGGSWQQRLAASTGELPLWEEDLSAVADGALADAIETVAERAARSLDITRGPTLRAVHMTLGGNRGARLLLVVHHLVVDGISWRIILEDLEAAHGQAMRGERIVLPPKTTSFQRWAVELESRAESEALLAQRPYWRAVTEPPVLTLPTDGPRGASNTVGEAGTMVVRLDAAETTELLQRVPTAYATQVNDVLLLALADALRTWVGSGDLLIDLEGHGRETDGSNLDLTRTIGWFTSVFPVRLNTQQRGDIGARLKAMKEQLRSVPRHGVGYGSLRYLAKDNAIARTSSPELVFNYLGQFDQLVAGSELFAFAPEPEGPWLSPAGGRRYLLDVNSLVLHGQLEFRWTFGRKLHDEGTIKRLADSVLRALREVIEHCRIVGVGGRTPSDFPLATLTQSQVDRLIGDGRNVEEIAPLVPMQSLFLATSAGRAEVGFEQWQFEIEGALDVEAFRRAWQLAVRRHEILRTSFHAEGVAEPVQVIGRQGEIPLTEHDWRFVAPAEQSRRLRELLDADRAAGVRIDRAPLTRLALVRTSESAWTLVWSHHHLLLDRWSWPIVLRDVGAMYQAIRDGRATELPPAPAWRHYLRWMAERDADASAAFWQRTLTGVQPRPVARLAGAGNEGGEIRIELTLEETAALARAARERQVTVNTLASLAWGLWLARATAGSDVVFGLSVAGRPEAVRGIEGLVGMCINNVPVRVQADAEMPVAALLARVDASLHSANEHAYSSLTDLQQWSGLPWHQRLFDTLVVFQHHGADDDTASWLGGANSVRRVADEMRTNYPLTLVVGGRDRMSLRLAYHERAAGVEGAERALAQLRDILVALPAMCDAPARALLDLVPVYEGTGASTRERARVAPRNDAEWVVARIWAEVLGCPVGVEDSFFDLGGQSLVATQIMARVQEGFRMELPVSLLFEHPTVESFVLAVRGRDPVGGGGRVDRIAAIIRRVEDMTDQELRAVGVHE